MKLLVFGLNYAPEPTGSGKYTGEMASWLASRGHQVDAIAAFPHYPAWQLDEAYVGRGFHKETMDGVRVFRVPSFIPPPDKVNTRNRIRLETSFSLKALRYWLPILASTKPYDAVIAVSPPLQVSLWPLVSGRLRKVPWVLHVQDLQVDAAVRLGMLKLGRSGRLLYRLENYLLRKADRVSTITESMRKRIVSKGVPEDRTWLFPNWSDLSFIRPGPADNSFRQSLGLGANDLVVMYAGNMGEKQGLELVIDAAHYFKDDHHVRFVLIGAGAARARLEHMVAQKGLPNVAFHPVQPLKRLPEVLAAADVHLVVQKREAADLVMPSKLTNVLAAGRPSLATADPGTELHYVLSEHNTGMVVPPGDVEQFVEGLRRLIADKQLRLEMGYNARKYAERYLDKDRILHDFEMRISALVQQCRRDKP